MTVSSVKLTDPIFKQLLLDIEKSNHLREDLTFGTICQIRPHYYDGSTTLKNKYGGEFDQIKRKTESAYIKLLDDLDIPPGPALERKKRRKSQAASSSKTPLRRQASSNSSSSGASSSASSASSSDSNSHQESVAKVTEILKTISIPGTILKKTKIMVPSESSTSNPIAEVLEYVALLESSIRQDGTLEYPFIHIVNEDFPERNRGLDIVLVPEIVHREHTRDAFNIRKTVPVGNAGDWDAFIPLERYPGLARRAIILRGPSHDFFTKDTERYHGDKRNINCEPTKKKHSATEQAINDSPSRQYEHTLLIFKKGVVLENHVFSDNAKSIDVEVNDMTADIDNGGDKLEVMGISLLWRIAVAGGSKLASGNPKKGQKKLFKKRETKDEQPQETEDEQAQETDQP